jgi:hypothetical protein
MSHEDLISEVREMPLETRLREAMRMVGDMCAHGRPPRMSIPVRASDEDFFICQTIRDAIDALAAMTAERDALRNQNKWAADELSEATRSLVIKDSKFKELRADNERLKVLVANVRAGLVLHNGDKSLDAAIEIFDREMRRAAIGEK